MTRERERARVGGARGTPGVGLRWLSLVATAGMFVVLLMGATVTNTGSAEGCGRSWPLCHGRLIPEFAIATLIEYSHRGVSGAVGLVVAAFGAVLMLGERRRLELRLLAPAMIGVIVLQAGLGAWAVVSPQTPAVLALHFGISLVAFATVFLATVLLHELGGADALRNRPIPVRLRWAEWGTLLFVYFVVYSGAYVRHAGATLGCVEWPLCAGALVPSPEGPAWVEFLHRMAAVTSLALVAALYLWIHRFRTERPDLRNGAAAALVLIVLQALSGGLVVLTGLTLFSALLHAAVVTLLFGSLSYLCLHVLSRPLVPAAAPARPAGGTTAAAAVRLRAHGES